MKPFSLLPGSKDKEKLSDERVKPVNTGSLWAHIRRIEARLDANEERTSTVRRDCDRLEKRLSREAIRTASEESPESAEVTDFDRGFNQLMKEIGG